MIFIQNVKKFTQSKFVRNVTIVATGTAMAQAVGVAFTPVITRLFGPEAFGLMGTFLSLGTIAASVSALTYPLAIVLPKKDSVAKDIARLSIYISLGMASLAALLIIIAGDRLFALIGAQAITAYAMLIPLKMLFSAWLRVAQQWFIRKKSFKATAKIEVLQSLLLNSAKIGIGWFKPIAAVLILVSTFGIGLHVLMFYLSTGKVDELKRKSDEGEKRKATSIIKVARKYYDFPLYRAPVVFIDDISASLPVLMLSAFFGPVSAGFYVLGHKLLKAPSKLIGKSVANVFYPKITKAAHNGKNLRRIIINATIGLAAVGFMPYAAVVIFGPWIFKFIFGTEWVMAGEYARWMAFMLFFQFIARPSGVAIVTLGLQKGFLVYELISTAFKISILYAGFAIYKSEIAAVALFSLSGVLSHMVLMCWVIVSSEKVIRKERYSDE